MYQKIEWDHSFGTKAGSVNSLFVNVVICSKKKIHNKMFWYAEQDKNVSRSSMIWMQAKQTFAYIQVDKFKPFCADEVFKSLT